MIDFAIAEGLELFLKISDLLDVKAICEAGSMRRAATVLGVTQPTLSTRIAHVEDQLGAPLFDRSKGQSQPTDLALFIASRAGNMAAEGVRLTTEVKRVAAGKAGLVRVGLSATTARVLMPDVAVRIAESHPGIKLDLLSAPTGQLAQALVDRQLDLLVCPPLELEHPALQSESLFETDIVVVARPGHPLCSDPPADLLALFEYPIALPMTERHYLDLLKTNYGIDIDALPGRILCSDPAMLARIVQQSARLFTAAPRYFFAPELDAGTLCVVRTPVPFGHSVLLHWNRDAFALPAVATVREQLRVLLRQAA